MVIVKYIDNDEDEFETVENKPWYKWIPEQQAYLVPSVEEYIIIPAAFVKCLKHIEVKLEK